MEWLKDQLIKTRDEWNTKLEHLDLPQDQGQAWGVLERKLGLSPEMMLRAIEDLGIETVELDRIGKPDVPRIDESDARRFNVVAVDHDEHRLVLASSDPLNDQLHRDLSFALKTPVKLVFTPPDQLSNALNRFYAADLGVLGRTLWVERDELESDKTSPDQAVAKITHHLLAEAVRLNASDIHLQSFMGGGLVRYRVDGLLIRGNSLPLSVKESLLRYTLTQAGLDISNHSTPQDGRLRVEIDDQTIDLRISYLPSTGDARLVIRLLYQNRDFSLAGLGLPHYDQATLMQLCQYSKGLILFTGPTGSGKTTSLYSMLTQLNRPELNIMTAEDPVEYQLQGISQIEVDERRERSFDTILRSMLRQDPDVILVGEIRDELTAQMAVRAVMTGHLVLSTLHTQDALGAVQRLVDLGVKQSQLAECLVAVIGQRMVRKLCTHCSDEVDEMRPLEQLFFDVFNERPKLRAIGCDQCNYSGYQGRFPLMEVYQPEVEARNRLRRDLYLTEPDLDIERDFARVATQAVVSGVTSVEEINRVLGADYWSTSNAGAASSALAISSHSADQRTSNFMLIGKDQNWCDRLADKLKLGIVSYPDGASASAALRHDVLIVGLMIYVDVQQDVRAFMQEIRVALAWSGLPIIFMLSGDHEELETTLSKRGVKEWCKGKIDLEKLQRLCEKALSGH